MILADLFKLDMRNLGDWWRFGQKNGESYLFLARRTSLRSVTVLNFYPRGAEKTVMSSGAGKPANGKLPSATSSRIDSNLGKLLDSILESFMDLVNCDGGSIYTLRKHELTGSPYLTFEAMRTRSLGLSGVPEQLKNLTFAVDTMTLVGKTAQTRQPQRQRVPKLSLVSENPSAPPPEKKEGVVRVLRDLSAGAPEGVEKCSVPGCIFEGAHDHARSSDQGREGHRQIKRDLQYETRTILSAPLITPRGDLVGVVQLLNKFPESTSSVESSDDYLDFDDRDVRLLGIVAAQAALAIENSFLLAEQEQLLEGFVNACVTAIESRDRVTSGHSHRVADYTVQLAEGVNRDTSGLLSSVNFTEAQLREIRFAALLHDIGKIAVKETILSKEKKLFPHELELIQMRLKMMRAQIRLYGKAHGVDVTPQFNRLETAWDKIRAANEPTVLPADVGSVIEDLMNFEITADDGERLFALNQTEALRLTVKQGSLSPDERVEIERHVTATYEILKLVPWSRGLENVAEYAYRHHEKMDGTGYPLKCPSQQIPTQSRMLTICDIYDALTADDRPYKKSLPVDVALDIIGKEVAAGKLDANLFDIFRQLDLVERMRRAKPARKAA